MSNLISDILALNNKYVTIGIHGDKGEQKKLIRTISAKADLKEVRATLESAGVKIKGKLTRHRLDSNLTVAKVAAWNEFGTKRIPERSFLRSVFKEKRSQILSIAKRTLLNKPSQFYEIIGQYILNEVNRKIAQGVPPPNKKSTIEWKGSSKPLVDTGQLKASLTFKVSDK